MTRRIIREHSFHFISQQLTADSGQLFQLGTRQLKLNTVLSFAPRQSTSPSLGLTAVIRWSRINDHE